MSLIRGDDSSSWSLPGSVDALSAAARQAGRPGAIWIAGIGYQFVVLSWTFGTLVMRLLAHRDDIQISPFRFEHLDPVEGLEAILRGLPEDGLGAALGSAPLVLIFFRLATGLAQLSPGSSWRAAARGEKPPTLRRAWQAGRGITLSAVGLWMLFVFMMLAATLLFAGPALLLMELVQAEAVAAIATILQVLTIGFLLVYGFLLSILFQLGLHSLAHNRRGAGSALQHSWRIARNDPLATARATLVDGVLYFTILALGLVLLYVQSFFGLPPTLFGIATMALIGFGGCARCAFWARAYQSLGGLTTFTSKPAVPAGAEPSPEANSGANSGASSGAG